MLHHSARSLMLPLALAVVGCAEDHRITTTAEDLEQIRQSTEQFMEAVRTEDFKALTELYTVDAVVMPPNELPVQGRDSIAAWFANLPPLDGLELTILEVDGHEDMVFVRGQYVMAVAAKEDTPAIVDTGKYLEVRHRVPSGDWLITVDMFSSNLPAK